MFILDTTVLSVMMSARPEQRVVDWLLAQPSGQLYTAAVCQAEILSGISIMPDGRRRATLQAAAQAMFAEDFEGRVLPFDAASATAYADAFALRRNAGRSAATLDLMIAANGLAHGARVVTRNVADFDGVGVTVVNSWED